MTSASTYSVQGEEVAVYCIRAKAVWMAELKGSFWAGTPSYVLCGLQWKLGDTSLPVESLFTVHAKGNRIKLQGMSGGYVVRLFHPSGQPTKSDYSLRKADCSSEFVLVNTALNLAEAAAFEAAIKGATSLVVQRVTAALVDAAAGKPTCPVS